MCFYIFMSTVLITSTSCKTESVQDPNVSLGFVTENIRELEHY